MYSPEKFSTRHEHLHKILPRSPVATGLTAGRSRHHSTYVRHHSNPSPEVVNSPPRDTCSVSYMDSNTSYSLQDGFRNAPFPLPSPPPVCMSRGPPHSLASTHLPLLLPSNHTHRATLLTPASETCPTTTSDPYLPCLVSCTRVPASGIGYRK